MQGKCVTRENSNYADLITDDMLCAMTKKAGPCRGDSGGPMTVMDDKNKHYIVGVNSHGKGCASVS